MVPDRRLHRLRRRRREPSSVPSFLHLLFYLAVPVIATVPHANLSSPLLAFIRQSLVPSSAPAPTVPVAVARRRRPSPRGVRVRRFEPFQSRRNGPIRPTPFIACRFGPGGSGFSAPLWWPRLSPAGGGGGEI